uniref:IlGF domain-containing protein n=1 Tax=Syphacia muris TaxID=451379 RepID=A0A0N5AR71_9BILA
MQPYTIVALILLTGTAAMVDGRRRICGAMLVLTVKNICDSLDPENCLDDDPIMMPVHTAKTDILTRCCLMGCDESDIKKWCCLSREFLLY